MQEQGLFAESVARHEQALVARVPDGEGEHAAQVIDDILSPVLVCTQQDFRIGVARETVAQLGELPAQVAEVVDLAVERQCQAAGRIAHRLVRAVGIDDRQAPVPQEHALADTAEAE